MKRTFISAGGTIAAPMLPRRSVLPDFGGRLFAAYVLGTAPFTAGKLAGTPATDLSGNGRDLTFTGAGPGAQWMDCSPTSYATCPFTCREVWEIASEISLIAVSTTSPAASFELVGGRSPAAVDGEQYFSLSYGPVASGSTLSAYNEPTQAEVGATVLIPRDIGAERDPAKFEVAAASWSTRGGIAWRSRIYAGTYVGGNIARPGFGGFEDDTPVVIGAIPSSPESSGSGKVALVMVVAGQIEIDAYEQQLYLPVRALLADWTGVAV